MLENVNSSDDRRANVVADFETVRYVLGPEVVTDAARHNSCAHRVRAFWTDMANAGQLQKAIELTDCTTDRVWKDCLEPNHRPNTAIRQESRPFYLCNASGI